MTLIGRAAFDPAQAGPAERREVGAANPNLPVYAVRTIEELPSEMIALRHE